MEIEQVRNSEKKITMHIKRAHFYYYKNCTYLQCIVLGDSLHHVWHCGLKNLLEREGIHHGEDPSKVLQNLLLLLHAHRLTVGHPDVSLLVISNLYLLKRNSCYTGATETSPILSIRATSP